MGKELLGHECKSKRNKSVLYEKMFISFKRHLKNVYKLKDFLPAQMIFNEVINNFTKTSTPPV